MNKKFGIFLLLFLCLGFFLSPINISARMTSDNYIIYADVFNSGGSEDSDSSNYSIYDSIGEGIILSATSTSANYGIKAGFVEMYVDQYLSFSIADSEIELGTLTDSTTGSDSNTMVVNTNASNGFSITVSGSTLTSGVNTIDAIGATADTSLVGSEQFGINLVANTTPSVGANPSGSAPIGSAASEYNTADSFAFNSGDTVASAVTQVNQTTFTVSYIANIASETESGTYTTTLTYAATANF